MIPRAAYIILNKARGGGSGASNRALFSIIREAFWEIAPWVDFMRHGVPTLRLATWEIASLVPLVEETHALARAPVQKPD